ncbi:MAG TPA: LCP family protein [Candidatus Dormibacteraeota bacterium]|nr:LCP family protein [Candidatus Dormibacteraeota bacterium]
MNRRAARRAASVAVTQPGTVVGRSRLPAWLTRRRTVVAAVLVVVFAVTGYVWIIAARIGKITHQNPLSVIHDVVAGGGGSSVGTAVHDLQRITVAIYGYGGSGHDGAFLTDTILLVVIQPRSDGSAQIAEVSVPRDWYVPIDLGNGHTQYTRVNEAYADAAEEVFPNRGDIYKGEFGPGRLANDTLDHLLGIHIDHFIGLDFHAFEYAVDAVGGVDINVEHTFTDTEYPHGECDQGDCAVTTIHFDAGPQHMDGARALKFARSRKSTDLNEGTDFARSRRQQLVIAAVKEKVVGLGGLTRLPAVLSALGDHVVTDMTLGDAEALYSAIKGVDSTAIEHVVIDYTNFLYPCGWPANCGAYVLFAHDPTYKSVQHYMANVIPDPTALREKTAVSVVNASGNDGASARWASMLQQLGFNASDGGTQPVSATTKVLDGSGGKGTATASWLAGYFATGTPLVTAAKAASSTSPPGATAKPAPPAPRVVTLVIGQDEEHSFNTPPAPYYRAA